MCTRHNAAAIALASALPNRLATANHWDVVRVERLAVEYKAMKSLAAKTGTLHKVTKKEFCRLLKTAELLPAPGMVGAGQ